MRRKKLLVAQAITALICAGSVSGAAANGTFSAQDLAELKKIIEQQQKQLDLQAREISQLKDMVSKQSGQEAAAGGKNEQAAAEMPADLVTSRYDQVDVQLYGHINRAVLGADNGDVSEAYFVDNNNSQTRIGLNVSAAVSDASLIGGRIEYGIKSNNSSDVNQLKTNDASSVDWNLRHADIFYSSQALGKFSLGKGSAATDGIAEIDLSGTSVATYSDLSLMAGAILFYDGSTATLSDVEVGDVFANFDGGREDRFRYDTPEFSGFTLSGSLISGDAYDATLRYSRKYGTTRVAAGIGWLKAGDTSSSADTQYSGSLSMLMGNGLNVTLAGGIREMVDTSREDGSFWYAKLGYRADLFEVGKTSFAIDYGINEHLAQDDDEATSWSLGAVQDIPAWGTELYLVYRQYDLDRQMTSYDTINTVFGGARVKF